MVPDFDRTGSPPSRHHSLVYPLPGSYSGGGGGNGMGSEHTMSPSPHGMVHNEQPFDYMPMQQQHQQHPGSQRIRASSAPQSTMMAMSMMNPYAQQQQQQQQYPPQEQPPMGYASSSPSPFSNDTRGSFSGLSPPGIVWTL